MDDGDEAKDGEGEEDPLVAVLNDGGDEASDDHEDVSEEQVDENVVGSAGEFAESVEHDGGSDYPVNVTSVEERAAIRAASVGTVAGSHGEVGKGSDEANEAFGHGRAGEEGLRSWQGRSSFSALYGRCIISQE